MFGNLAEMANMLKKAKEIKGNMQAMKSEMAATEVSGTAAGGKVIAVVGGDFTVKRITIDPSIEESNEMLAQIVTIAINDAINNTRTLLQQKMKDVTGGLDIPDIF